MHLINTNTTTTTGENTYSRCKSRFSILCDIHLTNFNCHLFHESIHVEFGVLGYVYNVKHVYKIQIKLLNAEMPPLQLRKLEFILSVMQHTQNYSKNWMWKSLSRSLLALHTHSLSSLDKLFLDIFFIFLRFSSPCVSDHEKEEIFSVCFYFHSFKQACGRYMLLRIIVVNDETTRKESEQVKGKARKCEQMWGKKSVKLLMFCVCMCVIKHVYISNIWLTASTVRAQLVITIIFALQKKKVKNSQYQETWSLPFWMQNKISWVVFVVVGCFIIYGLL